MLYGADPREAAYAECLAAFRVAADLRDQDLGDLFSDELASGGRTLLEQVAKEFNERDHMGPGRMPAGWRFDRLLYRLELPSTGWFVDISHSDSVAAINRELPDLLAALGVPNLTVGDLQGEDRELTTAIAQWVWNLNLDDGSRPHGIIYPSKHGDDYTCVAVFLRMLSDGKKAPDEPTKSDDGSEIRLPEHNAALAEVARKFDLHCF